MLHLDGYYLRSLTDEQLQAEDHRAYEEIRYLQQRRESIANERHRRLVERYVPPETYRQEYIRCPPHKNCRTCQDGPGHGPYWYGTSYNMYTGKRKRRYYGKEKPAQA